MMKSRKQKMLRDALKKAQEENNLDDMKAKRDDLNKIVQDLSVKMYEQAAKEQQAKGGDAADQATGDAKKDDDTLMVTLKKSIPIKIKIKSVP